MKVLLIGYGKMGRTIEQILLDRGHTIAGIVDQSTKDKITDFTAEHVDVAIEFTQPTAAYENITTALKQGLRVVSGTTGWLDRRAEVEALASEGEAAFFYASNFSLGVNIFFALNKKLAAMMNPHPQYTVSMEEIHHTEKLDEPSGTAITLAEGVIEEMNNIKGWYLSGGEGKKGEYVPIKALREPEVPGTHSITYESEMDSIEIKHTAHTRKSFALGAVVAAEWLNGKRGVYGMQDMLEL
ncbi:4-hydroxy-tetrahydrodipicolinate reductase [Algivirga pacifica]|uniref:4-hydroxy-tetrahydrodipicolinate reductase n=1 Tax=Algivirga pacifica TaxID=1162670 RepID=A0ABP9D121_9BACT